MTNKPAAFVAYLRVSTVRQGESGHGLEAQGAALEAFARQHGGATVASFVEVETGKRSDRLQLAYAREAAPKRKATLLIAKLDRLARNVAFIANLMDAGVEFLACDQPFASRLTLHILAAVAEDEARQISERTKAARRRKLGSPRRCQDRSEGSCPPVGLYGQSERHSPCRHPRGSGKRHRYVGRNCPSLAGARRKDPRGPYARAACASVKIVGCLKA